MVEVWLGTDFAGGRHLRRVRKIEAIEGDKDPTSVKNNND
jgi:ribose 5-phosphate isomerase RpiB